MKNLTEPTHSNDNLKIHFKYFAFIAFSTVIFISTERWSSNKDFTTYISNAATMTSLLLGVVAIFYSFISNDSLSRSLGSISIITNEIASARDEIKYFSKSTESINSSNIENISTTQELSASLKTSLNSLQTTLADISIKNSELQSTVLNIPQKLEQLSTKVTDLIEEKEQKDKLQKAASQSNQDNNNLGRTLISRASTSENIFIYAVVLAFNKKDVFRIPDVSKYIQPLNSTYLLGYAEALTNIRLIDVSRSTEGGPTMS